MSRKSGFTLVEIMIVVAIIGLLAAIAIPSFVKARDTSRQNACINNLRQIDSAKEQWAMANNIAGTAAVVTTAVNTYIKGEATPVCPASGTYTYQAMNTDPTCTVTTPNVHTL
jgi:prepilin-type N-terminal cleavage/methylation domain-containing protein